MSESKIQVYVDGLAKKINDVKNRTDRYVALTTAIAGLVVLTCESYADALGVLEHIKLQFWTDATKKDEKEAPG